MIDEPLRVAIIGCGWAGVRHAHSFAQCGAEIRWAIDVDLIRAAAVKAATNREANVSKDFGDALNDPAVDAVDICLPHDLHGVVCVAAAQAGKHILCEKPIAATLEEADQMIAAAEQAGVILMIAENEQFHPVTLKVGVFIKNGVIGRPALFQMTRECYLTRSFVEERPWFLDARAAAGGVMMAGGVHDFNTANMIIGDVESVYALRAPQRFIELEGDDTSVAVVRFRNGAVGTFVQSYIMKSLVTAAESEIHTLRVDGELGSISVEDGHTIRVFSEREDMLIGERLIQHEIYVPEQDTFFLEVQHFIRCIQTGSEPITNGRAQRRPLEIVLAAYQSMQSGEPVRLP
jgi:predicted dehydrogenase